MHRRSALALPLLALPFSLQAQPQRFLPGSHYEILKTPVRTSDPDRIEVTEFFWYGCPACFQLEPRIEHWLGSLSADVVFKRLPALGGGLRDVHAQAYYTALALNEAETLHTPIFNAIHQQRNPLGNPDMVAALFESHGVSRTDFDKAWTSFAVDSSLKKNLDQLRKYGTQVRSTPSLIVNGKFVVVNQGKLLDIVDYLIDIEKAGL